MIFIRIVSCLVLAVTLQLDTGTVSFAVAQEQLEIQKEDSRKKELWCNEHSLPEDECFICHPELRQKGRLWCNEHGRYEDRCWLCHPELEDKKRPYCEKHFMYVDECKQYHPEMHNGASRSKNDAASVTDPHSYGLWCKEHSMPEDECFICHPELRQKGRLWCNEHGRYEDRCWLCHPELEDKERPYCEKHFMYKDECKQFHRDQQSRGAGKTNVSDSASGHSPQALYCKEHNLSERECGLCHPELLSEQIDGQTLKVRLPGVDSEKLSGIKTVTPEKSQTLAGISVFGEIKFNENETVHLVAPVKGVIKKVYVDLGDRVTESQELLSIWSPTIGEAASEAILARQTLNRIKRLRKKNISSKGELEKAEAKNRAALQHLKSLGFADEQLKTLGADPAAPIVLTITAPFESEVVARDAVRGEYVETGHPMFTLTDINQVWANFNVSEKHLGSISEGQQVRIHSKAFPDEHYIGKIIYVSASIDPKTRMAVVRASVDNSSRQLRNNMFVEGSIDLHEESHSFMVPAHSIQNIDGINVAFAKIDHDLYEVRPVRLGARLRDRMQVLKGLNDSHNIVSDGSQALKSHFLISRLGAGCVH